MSDSPLIYAAISAVMDECGAVSKSQRNEQQKFMYRGIDAVMNALQPAMIKHGVFVSPEVLEQTREERTSTGGKALFVSFLTMRYTFYAKDGSSVQAVVVGEAMDLADKATNKAMSIAFKYACFQVFCIPTEEMQDPDADTPPDSIPKDTPPPKPKCYDCTQTISGVKVGGVGYGPEEIATNTKATYGVSLCYACAKKRAEAAKVVSMNDI